MLLSLFFVFFQEEYFVTEQVLYKAVSKPLVGLTNVEEATSGAADAEDHIGGCAGEHLSDVGKVLWLVELVRAALCYIRCNPNLTIKPPDKGGIVVTIHNFIIKGGLPPTASNLIVPQHRTARFYLLRKIHKPDYPGRPHYGLKALCFFHSHRPNQSPSTNTLIRLSELFLTLNNFSFNASYFVQTKWVAMGNHVDPSYACLFEHFINFINTFHPNLKFTWTISDTCLSFL
eukprot:g35322.t1